MIRRENTMQMKKTNRTQNLLVDFLDDDQLKGFRLHRLEVFNWGTFNNNLWMIEPHGFNSLLTGEIGSGKSTLVDALTTLLVPPQKITYNQAAGALRKERNLKSYVLGSHKSERDEYNNSKPVNLREENDYSVLLCYFYNRGLNKGMTLAQIFWVNDDNVNRLFVTSEDNLSIKNHFSLKDNETEITALKKRISDLPSNTHVFDTYKKYSISFQQYFGIKSDKVLELFFQTVSMKSIDKLTLFMRNHMLEEVSFKEKIKEMIDNYDDLTRAYESIQKAKKQIDTLDPMMDDIKKYKEITIEIEYLYDCLKFLPHYIAEIKHDLLIEDIKFTEAVLTELNDKIAKKEALIKQLRDKETDIISDIKQDKDGQTIQRLKDRLEILDKDKKEKLEKQEKYAKQCTTLGISTPGNEHSFKSTIKTVKERLEWIEDELEKQIENRSENVSNKKELDKEYSEHEAELQSLKLRNTQIPSQNLKIRNDMLEKCSLEGIELPFAGELIKVKSSEKEWEGALERLLHNFGLSLLVPEEHYKAISEYVNRTNLRGRLVYFKVPNKFSAPPINESHNNMVSDKLEIKINSKFYGWIYTELITKFDLVCCESIEEFQTEKKAITKTGQIKGSGGKHEKDDRKSLTDRGNYVLGWDNKEKIKNIEQRMNSLFQKIQECIKEQEKFKTDKKELDIQKENLNGILSVTDFNIIDWQSVAKTIDKYKREIEELEQSSDHLITLRTQLSKVQEQIGKEEEENRVHRSEETRNIDRSDRAKKELEKCKLKLDENPFNESAEKPDLSPHFKAHIFSITTIDQVHYDTDKNLNNDISKKKDRIQKLSNAIASKMSTYRESYPEESIELRTEMEDIPAYIDVYNKLKEDNLPKFEENFKKELREHTIQSIITFNETLNDEVNNIKKNIKKINEYLHDLQYNPGTYIELRTDEVNDQVIREFRHELKECLSDTFAAEDGYNEERFYKVKHLLDQFKEADKPDNNWTSTVTDVRNWLNFSAVEKCRADDSEKEYYSDSSGKSGGQKEKLAYTILASALAYRFGPGGNNPESSSFRFVIIDEAFGRSSDESTRYGLELFKKLNLQLLLVTPLKSIDVVTDYINFIHMISNKDGHYSMVTNLTVQEYKENKAKQHMEAMM